MNKKLFFFVRFYILCENFSKIGPIIKKIPKFPDDPLKPSKEMAEFVINSFALLDLLQKFIKSTSVKKLCQQALEKYAARPTFSCITQGDFCWKLAIATTIYIFYNNKQKCS